MKNLLLLWLLLCSATQWAYAQNRTVQGVVRDREGPVPGVAVYEKSLTSNGVTTDVNGAYRITMKGSNDVLVFRSVNYKLNEVKVGTRTTINVTMESTDQNLEEVTVVGFGEQKKITQTGSVSQVSGKDIRENPSASLQNTLVGRLPGFFAQQPSGRPGGDGANFYIRGVSSYNSNNQPLIIVDDIQYSYDQFARLDPNEIESLAILKDAATTAIYGVRGANGVVVVTTRRGKDGPPQISGRVEVGFSQPTKITNYLNAFETARLYNQAIANDNAATGSSNKPRFTDAELDLFKNGSAPNSINANGYDNRGMGNVDWRKELFKDWSEQYRGNIDISGGSPRVKYFTSLGYLSQNGMLKEFGKESGVDANYFQKRINYRSNLDINVTRGLDMRVDLYGNFAQVNVPHAGSPNSEAFNANDDVFFDYSSFATLSPFAYQIYNPDGSYGYSNWSKDVQSNANVGNVIGRLNNYGYRRTFENNINTVLQLKQDMGVFTDKLKGLSVTGRVAYTSNYSYYRQLTRGNNTIPNFIYTPASTNPTTGVVTPESYIARTTDLYRIAPYSLSYSAGSTSRALTLQGLVNYDRTFGGAHHVSGLVLYNRQTNTATNSNSVYNFIPANFLGYSLRVGYDYKERYLFQINAGYNGSDRFSSDKRYGLFPAVSAGWNIAEEPLFKNVTTVFDLLKLRASYGLVGNDALGSGFSYYYLQSYSASNNPTNTNPSAPIGFGQTAGSAANGFLEGTLPNSEVTWEKEKKFDGALEFRLLKNTLSGSVDYFRNERYDILTTRGTVSNIFGQTLPPVNLGRVRNQGIELELGYQSPLSRDFSYFIRANYSFAKNTILYQDEPQNQYSYQNYTGNSIGQQRVYIFNGYYSAADIADGKVAKPVTGAQPGDLKYQDLNGDGKIDSYDQSVSGYPSLPNTTYGINLGVRYKGFSVSVLFQGASNFNISGAAEAIKAFGANLTEVHEQAWTPALGDDARFPRLTLLGGISDPANRSTFWQVSGNYIRLKTAQINYDIPSILTRRLGIPAARIYANGTNLLTWTVADKLYDFDPEISLNTTRSNYPPQRLVNFGLSVTF